MKLRKSSLALAMLAVLCALPAAAQDTGPAALVPPKAYIQPGHSGSWADQNRRGQGFDLQVIEPRRALASWQTGAPEGGSQWLYADGEIGSEQIDFSVYDVSGNRFPGAPGVPSPAVMVRIWGKLQFKARSCENALLSWQPEPGFGYAAGSTELVRVSMPSGLRCGIDTGIYLSTDLGSPPAPKPGGAEGQRGVVVGGEVLVASGDGLWRRRLDGQGDWQRSGLDGFDVWFVSADPSARGRLFAGGQPLDAGTAPFRISHDGGRTWEATQSRLLDGDQRAEGFADVVVSPFDPDQLYASLAGGAGVALSRDGGVNFVRANDQREALFGYHCHLGVLPERADLLFQGCESLLDSPTLGVYDLSGKAPGQIGEARVLVDLRLIDNRRPQVLKSSPARPGWMYAGLEGALVAFDTSGQLEYLYRAEPDRSVLPYIYVTALWIDPANPRHLVFGGGLNGPDGQLYLYETFDHGLTHQQLPVPDGLRNPEAHTLVPLTADGRSFALVLQESNDDFSNSRMRVLRLDLTPIATAAGAVAPPDVRIRVGTGSRN